MSDDRGIPRCVRCGYALVGNPPPRRCPECGLQPRVHERWVDGELHREGPGVVLPVFVRQVAACVALLAPIVLGFVLNPETLRALEIPWKIDARWCEAATGVGAMVAGFLWTRPLRTRDAHRFGLDAPSVWRTAVAVMQIVWLPYAALLVLAMFVPTPTQGASALADTLMRWAAIAAALAQVPWILAMRHQAGFAEYLRDGRVRKSVIAWTWVWVVGLVVLAVRVPFQARYGSGVDLDETLQLVHRLCRVGLLWAGLNTLVITWLCAEALALAHEQVARDERRSEREENRYRVPD